MKKLIRLFVVISVFSSCTGTMITNSVAPSGSVIIGPNQQARRRVVIKNKSRNPITAKTFKNGKEFSNVTLKGKRKRSIYLDPNSKIEVKNNQRTPAKVRVTVPGTPGINIRSTKKSE